MRYSQTELRQRYAEKLLQNLMGTDWSIFQRTLKVAALIQALENRVHQFVH